MKVCGFSIIRNAVKYDYPVIAAIQSVLPLVDKFILLVGEGEDDTLALVNSISDKIEIHHSVWDDTLRKGGRVLAVETDKAFQLIPNEYDWAIYIQADEVLHEQDYDTIRNAMLQNVSRKDVDGLLLKYFHFYGSYDYVATSSNWYRNEIRIIKNNKKIFSFRDAQGFRKQPNEILKVVPIDATVYHYGWVKPPEKMQKKVYDFQKLWHDNDWISQKFKSNGAFDYSGIDSLSRFVGSHPMAIHKRIQEKNWVFEFDITKEKLSFKEKIKRWVESKTGWRPGEYKNYRVINDKQHSL
ncbi:MAG: glycosyltransferase family 2 protein [Saprospiraceae bacterium]|nr:glycosyltransferase family 2 protein [Saprospiraceae bacterium]